MNKSILTLLLSLSVSLVASAANSTSKPSKLPFSDEFNRSDLGTHWRTHYADLKIEDGVLKVGQDKAADHGAVLDTLVDFKDIELSFRFRFDGGKQFNVVIDDRNHKGSHAGHICRAVVRTDSISLGDDKTGIMENEIFAMRRDPKRKKESEKLLKGKTQRFPLTIADGEWQELVLIIKGNEMTASLNGKKVGSLTSEGIGHATKTDFGFTVPGRWVEFDDVKASQP